MSSTTLTVVADRCWDGTSDHPAGPTAVTVADGVIVSVTSAAEIPPEADVVWLGARTLLPGLIDCHVHLVDEAHDSRLTAYQTLSALPAMKAMLEAGFTTARDLGGAHDPINVALRQAVENGLVEGPRLIVAPNIISVPGGHGDKMPELSERYGVDVGTLADTPDRLRSLVREQARVGADWIKLTASGGFSSPADAPDHVAFTVEEMTAIVTTARDHGLPCAAHAFNDEAVRRALAAGVRSIEHANLASAETFARIADHGAFLCPTLHALRQFIDNLDDDDFWAGRDPRMRAQIRTHAPRIRESAADLADSEVRIAFGTDAGMFPHGDAWREFRDLTDAGLSPLRALRAATSVAADLLERPELGRITPGAAADLVAVAGDPFADIDAMGRVEFVVRAGAVAIDRTGDPTSAHRREHRPATA